MSSVQGTTAREVWKDFKEYVLGTPILHGLHAAAGIARQVATIGKTIIEVAKEVQVGVAATQFSAAFLLPFALVELVENIGAVVFTKEFFHGKTLDHALGAFAATSDIMGSVADATEAFVVVGAVAEAALTWSGPLMLAGACLSAIFWVIHGRGIHYNRNILKELEVKDLNLVEKLKDKEFRYQLKYHGGVDGKAVLAKLQEKNLTQEKATEIFEGLKQRIKSKIAVHALGIVITLIGIVAAAIFFATTLNPWVIAGCVLFGGLFILGISKLALDIHSNRTFKQLLKPAVIAEN